MEDVAKLSKDHQSEFQKYLLSPSPSNPALFTARAKLIEQLLLLGVSTEYMLKGILLRNGYALNREIAHIQKKLDSALLQRIKNFNEKDPSNWSEHELIYKEAENKLPKVSGKTIKLTGKTIKFEKCKNLFKSDIVVNPQTYFSALAKQQYTPSNEDTKKFYGPVIDSSNVLDKIQFLRNNYAHIPDAMYEERELIPFLYNYVVFISKKEFPETVTAFLQYI